ncbi:hypothetical protein BST61_g6002 [Cercospora zeina]
MSTGASGQAPFPFGSTNTSSAALPPWASAGVFGSTTSNATPASRSGPAAASNANAAARNLFSSGPLNQPARTLSPRPKLKSESREALKPSRKVEPFDPSSPILTVKVGTPDKGTATFRVHQDILSRSSDFLRTRSKEVWSESGSAIDIPNHTPATFKLYVNWAYSGLITPAKKQEDPANTAQADPGWKRVAVEASPDEPQTEANASSDANDKSAEKPHAEPDSDLVMQDRTAEKLQVEPDSKPVKQDDDNLWIVLARAYVLGEELMDTKFKSDVLASLNHSRWSANDKNIGPLVSD